MLDDAQQPNKPTRLYFKSYLQLVHNAVGSNMFRNLYVENPERGVFDALNDGYNACAFFVSSILVIFKKLHDIHGTVGSTVLDLNTSGWQIADTPQASDILVWEVGDFGDEPQEHIGFSVGDGEAISMSATKRVPAEHDQEFGETHRKITHIYRMASWQ
jgi:hypothetical protein